MTLETDLLTIQKYDVYFKTKHHSFGKKKEVLGRNAYAAKSQYEELNPEHIVTRVLPHIPDPEW